MAEAAAEPEAGFPASDTFVETMSQMIADAGTPGDHLNIVPEIITGLVGCAVGAVIVLCCWWRCVGSDNVDREHLVLPACLEMIPCLRSGSGPRRQGTAMGPPQQLAEMLASLSEPSSSGGSTRERVESGGISLLHSARAVSSSRDACSAHRRPQDDIDCVNFQELIVTSVKKGAQLFGPKFSKSKVLHKVVQERVSKLPDRAKAFMIEEMNSTAKEVLQAVHEPEPGMVVDWTSAVMEGMPSPIALLAGVVSPMVLNILYIAHIVQCVFVASLMVLSACVAAHDWNTSCPAVSSIYYWSYSQGVLAFLLLACRLHLIRAIRKGTGTIRGKSQEHADRVDDLDAAPNQMIDFMRSHVVLFQEWLVVEQEVLHSLWQHSVGFFTLLWLICVLWDAVLVLGWTGVPGKIAYRGVNSEETEANANFCDAKLTVFAAHFSLLLNMMFFFVTLTALLFWFVTSFTFSTRGTHHVIDAARRFDRENVLAIPLMEVCAKSLVLRGMTELPSVQVAIAAQKKARLDAELALLKQQVLKVESKIQEQSGVLMFHGAESALHVAPTSIDEQAAQLVETTLEDLERLVHWLYDLMLHVEHSESVQRVVHEASLISAESAAWAREHVAEMRVSMNESQAVQRTLAHAHDLAGKGAVWARHALQEAKSEAQESEVVMRALAKARAMAQRAEHAMQEVEESQTMTRAMIQAHAMAQRAEHAMQEVQESQTMTRAMIQAESRAHRHLEAEANGVQNHG